MSKAIRHATEYVERQIQELNHLDLSRPSDVAEFLRAYQRVHAVAQSVGLDMGTYNPNLED